jgi:enoyl-[acyl-carrier-protein] reductase (NADH)
MTVQRVRAQLEGRKALVVRIANDQSIAWVCARWLRALEKAELPKRLDEATYDDQVRRPGDPAGKKFATERH